MAKPRILWDAKGKSREEWLEVRAHGPDGSLDYTLGGSDIPIIFGQSPWTTAIELWHIKRGSLAAKRIDNEDRLEMGHLMEPIIGRFYIKKTGNTEIEDTYMYQHATIDYAIADMDARFRRPDGSGGILEKKFVTYRNSKDWDDGMVPPMYELQGRWYMAVDDSDELEFAALWGNNPESDLATPYIIRDEAMERMILDQADEFIKSLRSGIPPKIGDFHSGKMAMQSLARVYGKSLSGLPTVEFTSKYEKHIRRIADLQDHNAKLAESMRKNEAEIDSHSVRLAEVMEKHEKGEYLTPSERFIINYKTRITRRPDSKALKEKYPIIFDEVLKASESRKIKVSKEAV